MKKKNVTTPNQNNIRFFETEELNVMTLNDYYNRLQKLATSIFEWENLPEGMDERYLERSLFLYGKATLLYDKEYGFINTNCVTDGYLNIYGLPSALNCYSFTYNAKRKLYSGTNDEKAREEECVLVMNNRDMLPTSSTITLFAQRLANADRVIDTNVNAQRTPVLIITDEKQKLTMINAYEKYSGNAPVIFGNKATFDPNSISVIKTDAPFLADSLMEYKNKIWNEALSFLGINNIETEKKERMITGEIDSNNEAINLNLQSYLVPRKKACEEFNKLFGLEGTDKEVKVKVRSDLSNLIKTFESTISDYNDLINEDKADIESEVEI